MKRPAIAQVKKQTEAAILSIVSQMTRHNQLAFSKWLAILGADLIAGASEIHEYIPSDGPAAPTRDWRVRRHG